LRFSSLDGGQVKLGKKKEKKKQFDYFGLDGKIYKMLRRFDDFR
jgi:hypothetical protein